MGACVSQRGSHDTPDCGGYGNRQPKTTEQKGPVRGNNPHADHHAEASDEQRLDSRSVDHAYNDAGAGYRGLQTGVDCFSCPFARARQQRFFRFFLGLGRWARDGRPTSPPRARHAKGETERSDYRFPVTLHVPPSTNPIAMSFRKAVENKERQPLVV